jgi:Na+-translocating ferredoxin:NAD+ oxidoreductase RnfG subunit
MHINPNVQLKLYTSSSGVYAACCKAISESRLALNSSSFVALATDQVLQSSPTSDLISEEEEEEEEEVSHQDLFYCYIVMD